MAELTYIGVTYFLFFFEMMICSLFVWAWVLVSGVWVGHLFMIHRAILCINVKLIIM